MNLPNKLTMLRLLLVIPFITIGIATASVGGELNFDTFGTKTQLFISAGIIFIIAMITDFLDGYYARKNKQITSFGKLFDPIADKLIVNSALIILSIMTLLPVYIMILFILRDIIVDGLRNLAANQNVEVAASVWGKLKTMTQSIGIIAIFFFAPLITNVLSGSPYNLHWSMWLLDIPMLLALVFSYIGLFDYFNKVKTHVKTK